MNRSFSRYAILGGDGVFGIHMVKFLLDLPATDRVVSIGRNQRKPRHYSLDVGDRDARFRYVQAHMVHEPDIVLRILDEEKIECVINFAALAYATSWNDSYRYYDTNVVALAKLTEMIQLQGNFRHWMQIGSSEVYGSADEDPSIENGPLNPTSPYAVSKLAADLHLKTYAAKGFPTNTIRPSNAYGPGQQMYRLIPKAAYCALSGSRFPLEGGGSVAKSWLHASDLAAAVYSIITSAPNGEIYNAGPSTATSVKDVVGIIAEEAGVAVEEFVDLVPGRPTEDQLYLLDSTKIHRELGWQPTVDLREGIRQVLDWVKLNMEQLGREPQVFALRS